MADITKTLEIIFEGDDQLTKVTKGIAKSFEGIDDLAGPLADIANSVLAIDAALAAVAISIGMMQEEIAAGSAKLETTLDISGEMADAIVNAGKELFALNFGESITENVNVMQDAFQKLGDIGVDALSDVAKNALSIKDAFGAETQQTIGAVRTLVEKFGLTNKEAFDFITAGFQRGLDSSGDFLESITEYSTQFGSSREEAGRLFSVLESGLADGILGTDKAADAFKELNIRLRDGSTSTAEALKSIGINSETFLRQVSTGATSTSEAFEIVLEALRNTNDESTVLQAGAALLGTQFEDLGAKAALSIDSTKTKLEDLTGATEDLSKQYDTFGNNIQTAFRRLTTELADIPIFEGLKEKANAALKDVAENLPDAFDNVDWSGLTRSLDDIAVAISELFGDIDITSIEGLQEIIQRAIDSITSIIDVTKGMVEAFKPVVDIMLATADAFNSMSGESKEMVGNLLGVAQQIVVFGGAVTGVLGGVKALSTAFGGLGTASSAVVGVAGKAGLLGISAAAGAAAGTLLREYVPAVDKGAQSVLGWADSLLDFSGTQGRANESVEEAQARIRREVEEMRKLREATKQTGESLDQLNEKGTIELKVESKVDQDLDEFFGDIDEFSAGFEVPVGMSLDEFKKGVDEITEFTALTHTANVEAEVDEQSVEWVTGIIEEELPDGTRFFTYQPELDTNSVNDVKEELEEKIPPEQKLKYSTELEIAQLEQETERIKSMLDFKAKVDVAEIEAAAKRAEVAFGSINETIGSTGDLIGSLFGDLEAFLGKDATSSQIRRAILEQLEKENEYRAEALRLQSDLTEAQIAYFESRNRAIQKGQPLINITAGNLEPALELIFINILELCQIRAAEEGIETLIGL